MQRLITAISDEIATATATATDTGRGQLADQASALGRVDLARGGMAAMLSNGSVHTSRGAETPFRSRASPRSSPSPCQCAKWAF